MDWNEVFKLITAFLASVGTGSVIIFGLSSWLGKVWAERILSKEKNELAKSLEKTKRELDIAKETVLKFNNEKIIIYRSVIDVVAAILAALDKSHLGHLPQQEATELFHDFNQRRIQVYGYLAMLAPQPVMDKQDILMDQLINVADGTEEYKWEQIRGMALDLLNEIRIDIGIDKNPISYNGKL